jgi:hypothetical protein
MASSLNGTGITFSNATTLSSAPVTSVAATGGITGGTITTTGTLSLDTNNTFGIGSTNMFWLTQGTTYTAGSTVSGSYLFYGTAFAGAYDGWIVDQTQWNTYIPPNRTTAITFTPGSGITFTSSPVGGTWRVLGMVARNAPTNCDAGRAHPVMCIRTA